MHLPDERDTSQGRKEGRKENQNEREGRKEGRKENQNERERERKKEGRKEGRKENEGESEREGIATEREKEKALDSIRPETNKCPLLNKCKNQFPVAFLRPLLTT